MNWVVVNKSKCHGDKSYYIRVAKQNRKGSDPIVVIVFSVEAAKDFRWQLGDKVRIMLDKVNGLIGVQRCNLEGTARLYDWAHSKDRSKRGKGRLCVRSAMDAATSTWVCDVEPRVITKDETVFDEANNIVAFPTIRKV